MPRAFTAVEGPEILHLGRELKAWPEQNVLRAFTLKKVTFVGSNNETIGKTSKMTAWNVIANWMWERASRRQLRSSDRSGPRPAELA
jgi:hypothetical protein